MKVGEWRKLLSGREKLDLHVEAKPSVYRLLFHSSQALANNSNISKSELVCQTEYT